jgi:hypothetical protein
MKITDFKSLVEKMREPQNRKKQEEQMFFFLSLGVERIFAKTENFFFPSLLFRIRPSISHRLSLSLVYTSQTLEENG